MFSLTKLAYYSCTYDDKHWYDTVPKNVLIIELKNCCHKLFKISQGKRKLNFKDTDICTTSAKNGHIDCLMVAHQIGLSWSMKTCHSAVNNGHLNCLIYAHENGCPWNDEEICRSAEQYGYLDCLIYIYEHECLWESRSCRFTGSESLLIMDI